MDTPKRVPGNLLLRFLLEIAALVAWGWTGWTFGSTAGWVPWAPAFGIPLVAAVAWGTFNVPGDPSRSGRTPVAVPGLVRLALEAAFLGGAWAGLAWAGAPGWAGALGVVSVVHYAASVKRLAWMVRR